MMNANETRRPHPFILYWRAAGGGSLTLSIVLHALIITVAWFAVSRRDTPEPRIDFIPAGESAGSQRASQLLRVQSDLRKQKRRDDFAKRARIAVPHGPVSISPEDVASTSFDLGGTDLMRQALGGSTVKLRLCTGFSIGLEAPLPAFPTPFRSRCGAAERLAKLKANGGNERCERAVSIALEWLKEQQNPDGSWGRSHRGAMTGLALLAYFGRCETPDSPFYGDTTMKGLLRLVELAGQNEYGVFSTNPSGHSASYEHGIATYALGEMYALARLGSRQIPGVRDAFERGVRLIIDHQLPDGGWGYGDSFCYRDIGSGDLSVTGWQFQALKAAKLTGLKIEGLHQAIGRAVKFIETKQTADGGFGNANREVGYNQWNLTGVGLLGLQTLGSGSHRSSVAKGVAFAAHHFEQEPPRWDQNANLYAWYYYTQAFFQNGKAPWQAWNDAVLPELLDHQSRDGSWEDEKADSAVASTSPAGADRDVYRTALCTLMLEVYFRYLKVSDREQSSVFSR